MYIMLSVSGSCAKVQGLPRGEVVAGGAAPNKTIHICR